MSVPNAFTPGTVAKSSDVNANFTYLDNKSPKVGTVTTSGVGNLSVTSVGFKPKFVRFSLLYDGGNQYAIGGYGVMDGTTQFAQSWNVDEAAPAAATERLLDHCFCYGSSLGVLQNSATFVSFDNNGFTVNVDVAAVNRTYGYEAYY